MSISVMRSHDIMPHDLPPFIRFGPGAGRVLSRHLRAQGAVARADRVRAQPARRARRGAGLRRAGRGRAVRRLVVGGLAGVEGDGRRRPPKRTRRAAQRRGLHFRVTVARRGRGRRRRSSASTASITLSEYQRLPMLPL